MQALKFFDGSETGKGWDECSKYVVSAEAPFEGQFVGSLSGLKTIKVGTCSDYYVCGECVPIVILL
jgi:hypothetical protein